MANFEIPENPKYTEEIRKFDITDSAHAELFNGVIQALINNETFLKKIQEKHADDTEEQFQQQYEQLTGYTDTKIGQLINGAPETLDTIKEVADAILENETIIEALNEAIGKKLNKDGDISDATVAFTSEDTDESPTLWKDIGRIVSGKLKEILNRVSIMSNNLKYLRKLCGTTDVSKIADGTLTGIVNSLNTDIQNSTGYVSRASGIAVEQGWYRIARSKGHYGNNSCVISLKRTYNAPAPEYQKIQFFGVYNLRKFVSLAAFSRAHMWVKIRETWDEANDISYLEIFQNVKSSTNLWLITLTDAKGPYTDDWIAIAPTLTSETVTDTTVLASLDLPANNPA